MRNRFVFPALACLLALGACQTTTGGTTASAAQIQAAVLAACAYTAPLEEIAAVLRKGTGGLASAEQIATIVCQTAATVPSAAGAKTMRLRGVTLHLTRR